MNDESMDETERSNWRAAIADATDLRLVNILIGIAKYQDNREAAAMVAAKAKSMGFKANKNLGIYELPYGGG